MHGSAYIYLGVSISSTKQASKLIAQLAARSIDRRLSTKMEEVLAGEDTEWRRRRKDGGHGDFECSICLDPAGEPVVTPCGHLYCGPCMRRWMRSGQPAADKCPVCNAAVSEDRLVQLYGRRPCYVHEELCFDVHRIHQHQHSGWVLHSNAGSVIAGAAVAMLPWAFPDGRLPLPPRPVIVCNDGWRRKRVEDSLHQLWVFVAVAALLCFLLI